MANAIVEVIPQSAFCKLETQSNGVVCFQIQSPENQENKWYKIRSKSEGLRTRSTIGVSSSPCAGEGWYPIQKTANSTFVCVCVCELSCVQLFATPRTVSRQAPMPMGFLGKHTGVLFPFPGDLSDPGIKPGYLLYHLSHQGSPYLTLPLFYSGL